MQNKQVSARDSPESFTSEQIKQRMSSPTFLSAGGAVVEVPDNTWKTVSTIIYPGTELHTRGLEVSKIWFTAQAGDSSTGLELVLVDSMGKAIAGPSTTYSGSGVFSLMALSPVRTAYLRTTGPPTVLELRARNRSATSPPSKVGQLLVELKEK